jgi:hypothetical protein
MTHEHEKLVEIVRSAVADCDLSAPDTEDIARAALSAIYEAMKEPTPEMVDAMRSYRRERVHMPIDRIYGELGAAMLAASPLNGGRDA